MSILQRVLTVGEGRKVKRFSAVVDRANSLEPTLQALTDSELRGKTTELRAKLQEGSTLDDLLPDAFACVRESARRHLGQRHFDVQILGAAVLHSGAIAEMKTGEGKTLVATMPAYLNALEGKGVHLVTVNDYLAKRDAEWMAPVYRNLGVSVGLIQSAMEPFERKPSYDADITYGTNNEFGFDFLRDNMAMSIDECSQRGHHFAIVDEADSILIDEARTPLIISGAAEESAKWYRTFARIAPRLKRDVHYEVDEAKRTVAINEEGVADVERQLGVDNLYDQIHTPLVHYLESSLKGKELYKRDRDYIIQQGEVLIVDEFTGRVLPGRRWSDGLHQAVEAKENVRIKEENQTLATITLQNYFRLYTKLAGMTGTARTQAAEFAQVYKLDVIDVPTNRSMVRGDEPDVIYKTEDAKWKAVADDIAERQIQGQPVLVGTVSIEKSEKLAKLLERRGTGLHVLNAKQHEKEAYIVAQAGRLGAVTVATNMAGRGVDILLGGNPEYLARQEMTARGFDNDAYLLGLMPEDDAAKYEAQYRELLSEKKRECDAEHNEVTGAGGLYVLGTERHESRRIDNQLRGRAGRQGDPGESRFYLSLGDDLMKYFATGMISSVMERLKIPDDIPIEAKMVSKAIERAQSQVEEQNFEMRKNVLKYDEVMNLQRTSIYSERRAILEGSDLRERVLDFIIAAVEGAVSQFADDQVVPEEWDLEGLFSYLRQYYPTKLSEGDFDVSATTFEELRERLAAEAWELYREREAQISVQRMRELERLVLLSIIDNKWREHLYEMDYLREGIGLRAYGQRDPLVEYTNEGFRMFQTMQEIIKDEFVRYMFHVDVVEEEAPRPRPILVAQGATRPGAMEEARGGSPALSSGPAPARSAKVGRNDPCPCGSGKKYKRCHGASDS